MLRRCLPAVAMMLFSPLVTANGLDLNLNNDAARITGEFDLSNNLVADASWLHHQDRGNVVGGGLHLTGDATGGTQSGACGARRTASVAGFRRRQPRRRPGARDWRLRGLHPP
jgi:hypothetical protein